MNRKKAAAIFALILSASMITTACGSTADTPETTSDTIGTTAETVPINTETLASEQQEKVNEVADSLTGELENKTIKWMSFYDPWHPGTTGNTKPVSVELFEAKYGGEIEYYPTTWNNRFNDISTSVLGGEGIDFIAGGDLDSFPKGIQSGMIESFDDYVDWENPLWKSVSDINDYFELGGSHYVMATHASTGYVVYYNRKTIEENGFDDPAELFANGEWTMTKFKDMLSDYVDESNDCYGLDGWFNAAPLMYSCGKPAVQIKDGKVSHNLGDASFERAMNFQYELAKNGLVLDKSLFGWSTHIEFMGTGNELFYISGLYEIQQSPDIWTKTFGEAEDVMFVPIPKDEEADKYYLHAGLDAYMLCKGAQNPDGVARFMECIIASYNDENTRQINLDQMKNVYGWSDEMIEMEATIAELTAENPVYDIMNGVPTDLSEMITSGDTGVNAPLGGKDWYPIREAITDTVDTMIDEFNKSIGLE